MNNEERLEEAQRYIQGIRNPFKREYALKYLEFLKFEGPLEEPEHTKIGSIAAQAVRMHLSEMLGISLKSRLESCSGLGRSQ